MLLDDGEGFADESARDALYRLDTAPTIVQLAWFLNRWTAETEQEALGLALLIALAVNLEAEQQKRALLDTVQGIADAHWPDRPHYRLAFIALVLHVLEEQNGKVA